MKVKYTGPTAQGCLTNGKVYEVLSISQCSGWYRVVDDTDEDYLYASDCFEIVESSPAPPSEF